MAQLMKPTWQITSCFLPGACAAGNAASTCVAGTETACQTGAPTGAEETCNGVDDNCNGAVDEAYAADTSCFLPGACAAGNAASTCISRHGDCLPDGSSDGLADNTL